MELGEWQGSASGGAEACARLEYELNGLIAGLTQLCEQDGP
jgi:hypothetical protein